jgi:hypothetical protein
MRLAIWVTPRDLTEASRFPNSPGVRFCDASISQQEAVQMGKPIEIIREDSSAAESRALAASTRDGRVVWRLLAIALVLEGESREDAAQLNGMDRQTLRDWMHRYNEAGVAGLYPRAIPGRPGALTEQQIEELRTMVLEQSAVLAPQWCVTIGTTPPICSVPSATIAKLVRRSLCR